MKISAVRELGHTRFACKKGAGGGLRKSVGGEIAELVQDYRITVYDKAQLDDSVMKCFRSNFRVAAKFCKQKGLEMKIKEDVKGRIRNRAGHRKNACKWKNTGGD